MSAQTKRIWLYRIAGLVLLLAALAVIAEMALVGDPAQGGYGYQRVMIWVIIFSSLILGSVSMALFVTANNISWDVQITNEYYVRGLLFVILPIIVTYFTYNYLKSSVLLLFFIAAPFLVYLGGGYLILAGLRTLRGTPRSSE